MDITLERLGEMNEAELRSAIAELQNTLQDLHQDEHGNVRDLDAEQTKQFNSTSMLLARAERHLTIRSTYERKPQAVKRYGGNFINSNEDVFDKDALKLTAEDARDAALRALDHRSRDLNNEQGDQADKLIRSRLTEDNPNLDGSYIAKRLLLTESPEYRSAFQQMLTQDHPILTAEEAQVVRDFKQFQRAMNEGTPSGGGVGVPVFLDPTIMLTAQGSTNAVLQLCRKEVVTSNVWKGVSSAGVTWSFDPEGSAVSDDSPSLAQPVVPVYMARGWVPFSIELDQDYPDFAANVTNLLSEGYSDLAAQKMVVGSGTNEPTGVQTALHNDTTIQVNTTTHNSFTAPDVNAGWEALPERFKPRASWLMSYGNSDVVAGLGNSMNLSFVTVDLTQTVQTLRTRPVYNSAFMSTIGATSSTVAIVGDFGSGYLFASRAGMSVERIPLLIDAPTGRPNGQRGFFAWARFGSDAIVHNAFRLINNT